MFQYVNNFRGIAILLVILNHAFRGIEHDFILIKILYYILDNITVLFVVVAGYLFSVLSKEFNYLKFIKNKFLVVILPYFFISIPAILIYLLKIKTNHLWIDMDWFNSQLNIIQQYIYLMVYGAHLGPFWFVPMIVLFYIVSPLLYFISKHKTILLLAFAVSLIVSIYVGRPLYNENPLLSFCFFMPAYLLGMNLKLNPNWYKFLGKKIMPVSLVFIVLTCFFYYSYSDILNSSIDILIKLILSCLVFSYCYVCLNFKVRLLDMFARLSFFLYFIHGYIVAALDIIISKMGFSFGGYTAFLYLFLLFIIIIIASLAIFIIAKIVLKNKSKFLIAA